MSESQKKKLIHRPEELIHQYISRQSNNNSIKSTDKNLFCHFPEELPEATGLLKASSPLGRQLDQLLVTEVQVSDPIPDDLRIAGFITWGGRGGVRTVLNVSPDIHTEKCLSVSPSVSMANF